VDTSQHEYFLTRHITGNSETLEDLSILIPAGHDRRFCQGHDRRFLRGGPTRDSPTWGRRRRPGYLYEVGVYYPVFQGESDYQLCFSIGALILWQSTKKHQNCVDDDTCRSLPNCPSPAFQPTNIPPNHHDKF
jgi:hypothetical protein